LRQRIIFAGELSNDNGAEKFSAHNEHPQARFLGDGVSPTPKFLSSYNQVRADRIPQFSSKLDWMGKTPGEFSAHPT